MPPPDQRKTYAPASSLEVFHTGGPIALSRDGKLVAAACQEAINVVEVSTGKTLHNLPGDTEPITALAWSRDGKKIFSASRSMRCSVWDATTGESVRTFKAHNTPILHMTVDPSGTLLATCSADRTARVWDVAKGFCTHAFRGHAAMVTTALFHPDAKRLVLYTGAHDGEVRAWDLRTRECVGSMREHTSSVTSLAVPTASKNGSEKLLSAARDRVVHEWCSKTYKRLSTTPTHEACEGMAALDPRRARGMIGAAAADAKPDAAYFVTAGDKGIVRIWRVGSAKPIARGNSLKEESGLMTGGAHDGDAEGDEAAAGSFTSLQLNANGDGVLAVTGDHRLLFYGPDDALDDAGGGAGSIVVRRELIGNTDEIIAAAFLPGSGDEEEEEEEEEADVGQDGDEKRRKRAAKTKKRPRALAVATNSALLRVFDPSTMACTAALPGHAGAILSLDASVGPNGECLVITGSRDHTVRCVLYTGPHTTASAW
jgi:U3 small nucleolar RNA-associated protein 13